MIQEIYNHHNIRRLCKVNIPDEHMRKLLKPPALTNARVAEDHVVNWDSPHGRLVLFMVKVRDRKLLVTPTPAIAIANAVAE